MHVPVVREHAVGGHGGSETYCSQGVPGVGEPFLYAGPRSRVECPVADVFQPALIRPDVEPLPEYRHPPADDFQVRAVGALQPGLQLVDVYGAVVLGLVLDLVVSEDVPLEVVVGE